MTSFLEYLESNWDALAAQGYEHLQLVLFAEALAILVAVPTAILAHRFRPLRPIALQVASTILTIPSLALFGLFIPIFGLGVTPAVVALFLYAILPILANTLAGLDGVDPAITDAATGVGLGPFRRLWTVELPLAWPVILTGIRVSTQLTVGIAAIAVLVGGPGLGTEIFRGLRSLGSPFALDLVLGGTLGIVVIALSLDGLMRLFGRLTTSKGIR